MVEYFGEQLSGFAFTVNGWVQSYGSRCVKPPIIYGDVSRPKPMTVFWSSTAQSMTARPMKGMLTGPVTILNWSFVRNDQPRSETTYQIALAIKDEVEDLEKAGINVIQIDEAALREGLPLRKSEQAHYLDWAVHSFRITNVGVQDTTQVFFPLDMYFCILVFCWPCCLNCLFLNKSRRFTLTCATPTSTISSTQSLTWMLM